MTEYQSPPAADTVALLRSHGNCLITIKSKELKFFTIADFLQIFIHRFNMFMNGFSSIFIKHIRGGQLDRVSRIKSTM